jgi:FKBP-type peptidyl-prolyl cis-trans isomerase SlyD
VRVARHTVVSIDYTLTDVDGDVIDSSEGGEPLAYIHGVGSIVPGLEEALEGKSAGDQLSVVVPPDKGYGPRSDGLMQVVPRDRFDVGDLKVGMLFHTHAEDGGMRVVRVVAIEGDGVTIDGNHPLAGMTLNFAVTVSAVREATAEEIDHGHVHGTEGHNH